MKIVVLLKKTPDTEAKIEPTADGKAINTADLKYVMNPYDEFAVEEALKIKEKNGSGEVVIISFGTPDTREVIVKALAMGADRGLLINSEGLEQVDSLAVAKVLSTAVKAENADLVLAGKQGVDDDNMHVSLMTAELLGWPHANVVTKLEMNGTSATVEREVEGGQMEVYQVQLPAIFGAHKSLNSPRYASLPGIMKAKRKPFDTKTVGDLGLTADELTSGARAVVKGYRKPADKPPGKVFKDEPVAAMVSKVVGLLRSEAKVL